MEGLPGKWELVERCRAWGELGSGDEEGKNGQAQKGTSVNVHSPCPHPEEDGDQAGFLPCYSQASRGSWLWKLRVSALSCVNIWDNRIGQNRTDIVPWPHFLEAEAGSRETGWGKGWEKPPVRREAGVKKEQMESQNPRLKS